MLQQTQASRVVSKWLDFTARFPTAVSCAAAPLGDVLRLWQGLGYPRRARNLHNAAAVIAEFETFPNTLDQLLALPGVGQYTARAVMAFAFEDHAAVVDTNIARVYARVVGRRLTAAEAQQLADSAVPLGQSWMWNQCLMDLGAVLCRPTNPGCQQCPLCNDCQWHGVGQDPAIGSAGVSVKQARFAGSDRQARGRILGLVAVRPTTIAALAVSIDRPAVQTERLVEGLRSDGLVFRSGELVSMPD